MTKGLNVEAAEAIAECEIDFKELSRFLESVGHIKSLENTLRKAIQTDVETKQHHAVQIALLLGYKIGLESRK